MTKFIRLISKFEKKIQKYIIKKKNFTDFSIYKNIKKVRYSYLQQRKICVFCNRHNIEKDDDSVIFQIDNHIFDHRTINDYTNNIPARFFMLSINTENSLLNINLSKNFLVIENLVNFFNPRKILSYEFFNYSTNSKNKDYLFLKYRISKFWGKKDWDSFNWKNFLHAGSEFKGLKNNLISQRGEILLGFKENFLKVKENSYENQCSYPLIVNSIFFFRILNKKIYEFEVIKRQICSPYFSSNLSGLYLKELEKLHYYNFYEFIIITFLYIYSKASIIDINIQIRSTFFNVLNYIYENRQDHLRLFIRKFMQLNVC